MHVTVLLREAVTALAIKADGIYVDATFGRGGHSLLILSQLNEQGRLIALDRDPEAIAVGKQIDDPRFCIRHSGFSAMQSVLQGLGITKVDGVLLDLGVSSPQLEQASRGFSFRSDGALDMRMDTSGGQTAADWLVNASEEELTWVIKTYGEERFAKPIARAILKARAREPIVTTGQLAEIVASVVHVKHGAKHPATRTFQAIRIHINRELDELALLLPQSVDMLNPGGRLVVISFHSLEDRMVKRFMRAASKLDEIPRGVPLREKDLLQFRQQTLRIVGKAIRPGELEVSGNVRARSAVMRVAERIL